ncbi:MAG: hypothetical protein DMD58_15410, partial [Gemmatimonadetes bacterium]
GRAGKMSDRLHRTAKVAAVVGAVGSVALTLYAGRNNNLPLVMVLIAGWVFAPFFGFALASRISSRWSQGTRAALHVVIIVIAIASLTLYARDALGPAHAKRAAIYVAVPNVAWLLMLICVPLTAVIARRSRSVQIP